MTVAEHTLSFMLRNSGAVLDEVEHRDVRLTRRDASDLFVGTASREGAVRDGLQLASRALEAVLAVEELQPRAMAALEQALPWVGWLPEQDRVDFAGTFVRTVRACADTDNFEALRGMLARWKASAELANDPTLRALIEAEEASESKPVELVRPTT